MNMQICTLYIYAYKYIYKSIYIYMDTCHTFSFAVDMCVEKYTYIYDMICMCFALFALARRPIQNIVNMS